MSAYPNFYLSNNVVERAPAGGLDLSDPFEVFPFVEW